MCNIIVCMGVSGCGKSSVAKYLSDSLGYIFIEGDNLHSIENIEKMRSGTPLSDEDRLQWLYSLNNAIISAILSNNGAVVACSALKQSYRDILTQNIPISSNNDKNNILFVHLVGSYDEIYHRLQERSVSSPGGYFPPSLLQSQFDILEPPDVFSVTSTHTSNVRSIQVKSFLPFEDVKCKILNELRYPEKSDIGIFGLGTMGRSLARNFGQYDVKLSLYNRFVKDKEENVAQDLILNYSNVFSKSKAYQDLELFVSSLSRPRKIILLIDAGKVIDIVLKQLVGLLQQGDIVVDMGNSYFMDTISRSSQLSERGIHFCGCGISGGEYGALHGPSIMVSGTREACDLLMPYFNLVACKDPINNQPCCAYIGSHGSGHYVKMVHNGIEYAEMQLLSEIYQIMLASGKSNLEIADIFQHWLTVNPDISSYLLSITITILRAQDDMDSNPNMLLIDKILDNAKSKGTGNWATMEMAKSSIPATMIANSLFARFISSCKDLRVLLSSTYSFMNSNPPPYNYNETDILSAYTLARIINHIQGFWFLNEISQTNSWGINLCEVARIWTNGCIIRSSLMQEFNRLLVPSNLNNLPYYLLTCEFVKNELLKKKNNLQSVVIASLQSNLSVPCLNDSLNFINSITSSSSTSNLIQAQRDFFGAHTYQRIDQPREMSYHYKWPDI